MPINRTIKIVFLLLYLSSCAQINSLGSKGGPSGVQNSSSRGPASTSGFQAGHIGSDLGTIKWSILSEKTFQKIHGPGWVLMDGDCIAKVENKGNVEACNEYVGDSSDLYSLIQGEKVLYEGTNLERGRLPDARGRFLRVVNHGIGAEKSGTLGNPKEYHDPDLNRKIGSFQGDTFKKHFHHISASSGIYSGKGKDRRNYHGYMTRDVGPEPTKSAGNSPETRPKNIAVNVFIKINDD